MGEAQGWCVKIVILLSFLSLFCQVRNKMMCVLSWWTVSALTWVLFWCLFTTYQNDPLVSSEIVCQSSTNIILYIFRLVCHWTGYNIGVVFDRIQPYLVCLLQTRQCGCSWYKAILCWPYLTCQLCIDSYFSSVGANEMWQPEMKQSDKHRESGSPKACQA